MLPVLPQLLLDDISRSDEDPFAALNGMLNAYNTEHAGAPNHAPLWLFARDADGKVQAGLRGQTYWSWCAIDVLAVAIPYRRQGIGSRLLSKAEDIARERGCIGIRLDTTTFQAPEFYRRHGFLEFGRVENYPPGHARIWFAKRF